MRDSELKDRREGAKVDLIAVAQLHSDSFNSRSSVDFGAVFGVVNDMNLRKRETMTTISSQLLQALLPQARVLERVHPLTRYPPEWLHGHCHEKGIC